MLSRFVKLLNLPDVPKCLWPAQNIFDKPEVRPSWDNNNDWHRSRRQRPRTAIIQGQVFHQSKYARYDIDASMKTWIHDNITEDYKNIGLSRMWGEPVCLPHSDFTRDFALLYLFDCGGPEVYTKFWQRKNFPLHGNQDDYLTYDDLDLVFSTVLKPAQWYMLDARCIHSVEGMLNDRVSLQLGFMTTSIWVQQIFGEDLHG